jgi:hypothetical protein
MAIVDGKERALWPCVGVLALWPRHVEDDGDAILIVVPLDTLMSIGGVARNEAMRLTSKLGVFEILQRIEVLLVPVRVNEEPMTLNQSLQLSFDDAACTLHRLAVRHFSFDLLNHAIEFPINIWQSLL